ncbi:spore coat protein [Lysinibacillus odysseyi]|uniref:Spore gernimation protein GerQ n=1 Tax=Lysinibacillus odysseyi 34hs-1 = NBRC 100172 TaxID=1220589 RepID=A0A0A3IN50_9BACI|nr:spore coat protein [Lysinibacillus odysseyi]KGR86176.1 spore gernimation protein GerQ [Lysinibacillus odysseyi 34hs-1 = NBRC 100172]
MEDYLDPINSIHMPELTDSGIALELLLSLKTGVRTLSISLTETASPALRKLIKLQLDAMIELYFETSELMMKKEWLKPYDLHQQRELDIKSAQNAIDIASLDLFPEDMNRKGLFPTPPKE